MSDTYIKGLGIPVGTFSEADMVNGVDKAAVKAAKEKYDLDYTNQEMIIKKGAIYSLKLYVCNIDDMKL